MKKDITSNRSKHWLEWNDYNQPEVKNYLLNLKDKYTEYSTVPAYIINKDTSNYSDILVINVGANDGIKVDMAVIANEGLVGHVISVTDSTAKVQTLLDTSSAVSSVVGSSRDNIIVRGTLDNKKMLNATYIPTSASLLEGDRIETSGLGGIYPKGIIIGTIKEIKQLPNY